jgi:four helix bundle protein
MTSDAKITHYKQLIVWQRGMELAKAIYKLTASFPSEEKFGLTSQMRRAAVSVPSNIAEGQARHGTGEFLQFLSHASGSLAELETQLLLGANLGYYKASDSSAMLKEIEELQRMLAAIRRRLSAP